MDEMKFKSRLTEALGEPAVPSALVEKTVAWVKIMEKGAAAENRLREGQTPSAEEKASLLADSILGRLARSGAIPPEANAGALKERLMHNEKFQSLSRQDPKNILAGLSSGKLSGEILQEKSPAPAKTSPPRSTARPGDTNKTRHEAAASPRVGDEIFSKRTDSGWVLSVAIHVDKSIFPEQSDKNITKWEEEYGHKAADAL